MIAAYTVFNFSQCTIVHKKFVTSIRMISYLKPNKCLSSRASANHDGGWNMLSESLLQF